MRSGHPTRCLNWPQAASMSGPRERRKWVTTPWLLQMAAKAPATDYWNAPRGTTIDIGAVQGP